MRSLLVVSLALGAAVLPAMAADSPAAPPGRVPPSPPAAASTPGSVPAPTASPTPTPAAARINRWNGADKPYLAAVHDRIHSRWTGFLRELVRAPAEFQAPGLAVVIELVVNADGTIGDIKPD